MRQWCLLLACLVFPAGGRAAEKPELVLDASGHTAAVRKVLFTPDGKRLLSISEDKTIRVWDVTSGACVRTLRPPAGKGPEGRLLAAALSPDGRTLAVGGFGSSSGDHPVYLIDLAAGHLRRVLRGHRDSVFSLGFSPDGKRLASGSADGSARVWSPESGECLRTLTGHKGPVQAVAFSRSGRKLATASWDGTARVWSVATGKTTAVLRGHAGRVLGVAWSPDGKTIATGAMDRSVRLWTATGKPRKSVGSLGNDVGAVSFTADARALLLTLGGTAGTEGAALLDLRTARVRLYRGHANTLLDARLSPDGTLAASADALGEVHLWRTADAGPVRCLSGAGRAVWAAGWGDDGIAWGNTNKGDLFTAKSPLERSFRPAELELGPAPRAARRAVLARNGLRLALRRGGTGVAVAGGGPAAVLRPPLRHEPVRCATLFDGKAAVGTDFTLYLFDLARRRQLHTFTAHTAPVLVVAPSPDGRYLLSASADQTLRVWKPDRDEPLLSLFVAGDEWVAWTPEGYYACSAGGEALMGWQVSNGPEQMATFHPAAHFRKSLYRPDLIKRLLPAGSVTKALAPAGKEPGKATEAVAVAEVLPPHVRVSAPSAGARLKSAEVEVKATAASEGGHAVTALRLLVDGRPYGGASGVFSVAAPKPGEVSAAWRVTLTPGRHRFAVLADSAVSQGRSDKVRVVYKGEDDEQKVPKPTLYLLAVGVAKYNAEKLRLDYAARDAGAVADAFRKHGAPLFAKIEVKQLTDAAATRAGVLKGLKWLREAMTERDYAVVFFSGHGDRDSDGTLFFLPVDVDPDDVLSTAVPAKQLLDPLVPLPGKVLLLLDACHSGGKRNATRPLTDDLVRDLVREESGMAVMCSSTGREFSLENNAHRMSNFTLSVVEGLSGKAERASNGAVYLHHLDAYVTDRVKALTKGRQHPVTRRPETLPSFPLAKP
jgi:WD40 repeat protein